MQDEKLLVDTYLSVQDLLLTSFKWTSAKHSTWVTKRTLFRLAGKAYKTLENGQSVFYKHLKALGEHGYLPRFTTKNASGKRMCYNKQVTGFSDVWCKTCSKPQNKAACSQCLLAIRFCKLKPRCKLLSKLPKVSEFRAALSQPAPSIPIMEFSNFKGDDFTKYLLPRVLGLEVNDNCLIPDNMRDILTNAALPPIVKMEKLLDIVYHSKPDHPKLDTDKPSVPVSLSLSSEYNESGVQMQYKQMQYKQDVTKPVTSVIREPVPKKPSVWIAPTRECNARISLSRKVKLTKENSCGVPQGKYHVWGFNESDVYKWHTLQKGDYVLFGNTHDNFRRLGRVNGKFVWLKSIAGEVFEYEAEEKKWLFGFILHMETRTPFSIFGEDVQKILGFSYQSQNVLTDDKAAEIVGVLGRAGVKI